MNIVVLVKQVPDTTVGIKIAPDGTSLEKDGLVYMANPLDLLALEEAVRIREGCGSGNITVISMGPPGAEKILRKCIAQGADRAILVDEGGLENPDGYATALVLTKALRQIRYDLILCGARAVDTNGGQVGTIIGEMIGLEVIYGVTKIQIYYREKKMIVQKKVEHGNREVIRIPLPALAAVELGLNEPRYPDLPSIIRAQRAEIERIDRVNLAVETASAGSKGSKAEGVKLSPPKPRPKKLFTPPSDLPPMERALLIASGGIIKKKSNILDGRPKEIALSMIQFLKEHKLIAYPRGQ